MPGGLGTGDDPARTDRCASIHVDTRRYDKSVTAIGSLDLPADELDALVSTLKRRLAAGEVVVDGRIELQDEHGERLEAVLRDGGFGVKR